jgi:hypothetical protein
MSVQTMHGVQGYVIIAERRYEGITHTVACDASAFTEGS